MESAIGANESVSTAVLRAVSAVTGRDPDFLPPLKDVLDPDAMDALFEPRTDGVPRIGGHLSFIYSRCRITIDNGEFLTIEPFETTGRLPDHSDGTERLERSRSDRDMNQTTPTGPGSRICIVCQQPIDRENLGEEHGELVHPQCRATRRCGISLDTWSERSA